MKPYRVIPVAALVMFLGSCEPPPTPGQQAEMQKSASREVICVTGADCKEKWNAAIQWARSDPKYTVETSAAQIQASDPAGSSAWTYTITKTAESRSASKIDLVPICTHAFGCSPSELEVKAGFADAVLGKIITSAPSIAQLEERIRPIRDKCEKERQHHVLLNYEEVAECTNPPVMRVFRQAHYPYMDLARDYTLKYMKYARQVDAGQLTEDDIKHKMSALAVDIARKEQARNGVQTASE